MKNRRKLIVLEEKDSSEKCHFLYKEILYILFYILKLLLRLDGKVLVSICTQSEFEFSVVDFPSQGSLLLSLKAKTLLACDNSLVYHPEQLTSKPHKVEASLFQLAVIQGTEQWTEIQETQGLLSAVLLKLHITLDRSFYLNLSHYETEIHRAFGNHFERETKKKPYKS